MLPRLPRRIQPCLGVSSPGQACPAMPRRAAAHPAVDEVRDGKALHRAVACHCSKWNLGPLRLLGMPHTHRLCARRVAHTRASRRVATAACARHCRTLALSAAAAAAATITTARSVLLLVRRANRGEGAGRASRGHCHCDCARGCLPGLRQRHH
eukprot:361052-Chlamydomonas_euryale.AAC.3